MDDDALRADGWKLLKASQQATQVGPMWIKGEKGARWLGLSVEDRHCNPHRRSVHGGVLATMGDVALGLGAVDEIGAPRCVTIDLHVQYLSGTGSGAFLICRPEVIRRTRSLVFMRGAITTDIEPIAEVAGIWKILSE